MDDKELDHIFKTAFNSKSNISQEEGNWDAFEVMLKKEVKKKNFFFFKWNRFNIYSVGILLACLMSGTLIYCQNYLWDAPAIKNPGTNPLLTDTSSTESPVQSEENNTPTVTEKSKENETISIAKSDKSPDSISIKKSTLPGSPIDKTTSSTSQSNITDTVSSSKPKEETITPTNITTPTTPVVVMRRKKTVVVVNTPQDTIIKIDTVKVKKGKKK